MAWVQSSAGLSIGALTTLLCACTGVQPQSMTPTIVGQSTSRAAAAGNIYRSIYSFRGGNDGAAPVAGLLALNGSLYGTTEAGGGRFNTGTVFEVSPTGRERIVHAFGRPFEGKMPVTGLAAFNGYLYGTTREGGYHGAGSVFAIGPDGKETMLYSFKGPPDGKYPEGDLLPFNGALYGTTEEGGYYGGTVFEISTSGTERVIYSFPGGDYGFYPAAGLTAVKGLFYGTTIGSDGNVFSLTPDGQEQVLHQCYGGGTGQYPFAALTEYQGAFYTTTSAGGFGRGDVLRLDITGQFHSLYNFRGTRRGDGANPVVPLMAHDGWLYGTTTTGGRYNKGTVFRVNLYGKEDVLHSFGSGSDGSTPYSGLTLLGGRLYGTTSLGGMSRRGTVFSISSIW